MKILILEDDVELATGIEISLQDNELQFTKYQTIEEAKKQLEKCGYDLLIFDVNLPDGSGFELCQEVRKTLKLLILLLTARDMEIDIIRGLECGADDYITKPFSTMEFQKDGLSIELSRTEQRILYIPVFNEGQIITRERLLHWVWPDGTEQKTVYDESIESAIKERLNQLVMISKRNLKNADKDKTLVQSLISDISHQVRTPLTNIMLYAGILYRHADCRGMSGSRTGSVKEKNDISNIGM